MYIRRIIILREYINMIKSYVSIDRYRIIEGYKSINDERYQ